MTADQQPLYLVLRQAVDSLHINAQILQQKECDRQKAEQAGCEIAAGQQFGLVAWPPQQETAGSAAQAKHTIAAYDRQHSRQLYGKLPTNVDGQLPGVFVPAKRIIKPGQKAGSEQHTGCRRRDNGRCEANAGALCLCCMPIAAYDLHCSHDLHLSTLVTCTVSPSRN